jgi:membrane protease YdiL (CAAX protease family)
MSDKLKAMCRASNIGSLLLLIWIAVSIAASVLLTRIFAGAVNEPETKWIVTIIANVVLYVIVTPLLVLINNKLQNRSSEEDRFSLKKAFSKPQAPAGKVAKWVFITVGLGFGTVFATSIFFAIFTAVTGVELHQDMSMVPDGSFLSGFTLILCAVVFAPIFEEILFRGAMFGSTRHFGGYLPAVLNGLLFGLLHMNYGVIPGAMVIGICSCFLVAKTGSLIPSVLSHFLINGIQNVKNLLVLSDLDIERVTALDMAYMQEHMGILLINALLTLLLMGLGLAGLIVLIVDIARNRSEYILENDCKDIPRGKRFLALFVAPVTLIAIVYMTVITVMNALAIPLPWHG